MLSVTFRRQPITFLSRMTSTFSADQKKIFKYQPPVDRSMTKLDRSFFVTKIPLVVVQFPDPQDISVFCNKFNDEILKIPRISRVVKFESDPNAQGPPLKKANTANNDNHIKKGVLLKESITAVGQVKQQVSSDAFAFLEEHQAACAPYQYVLDYNFWKAEEIFRAILPEQFLDEIPSGFTATGHVAHINLRSEFKPFGELIGQVLLDKNSKIETVVDKTDTISSKFRTFQMQVLAGKPNLVVEQRESGCSFKFDFSKVYWNSRLHTEHDRLIQKFKPGECVGDVFAGVGPFAVPAGKKGVIVLANDLNPESYRFLNVNISDNKVANFVSSYNQDGREFIRNSPGLLNTLRAAHPEAKITIPGGKKYKDRATGETLRTPSRSVTIPLFLHHYVMNLPDSALTFLNEFCGLYSRDPQVAAKLQAIPDLQLPWIHCHCFEKFEHDETPEPSMQELHRRVHARILEIMQTDKNVLPFEALQFHLVRKVAPTKPMFCVSFQLPRTLAFA
ncbi:LAMI_0C08966g1_1 [Lachancea mirantina]|uniref:tRNA (guanine(37)-N1)-methyltransferase n=1 Tax=Lachancea mirantina TaxID=1230905 RepID=A0A1G4J568_9SACH|nr:LAMI_0C08966g1_1 [Lachancea mirantina]